MMMLSDSLNSTGIFSGFLTFRELVAMISLNLAPKISEEPGTMSGLVGFGISAFLLLVLAPRVCISLWDWWLPLNADLESTIAEAKRKGETLPGEIQRIRKLLTIARQENASRHNERNYSEMLQDMLNVLPQKIPVDVFMTSLSAQKWELVMEGGARDSISVAELLEAMKDTYPFMFFEVEEVRKGLVDQYMVNVFRLKGKLRNPKPLDKG